jgi:hypothetical protein
MDTTLLTKCRNWFGPHCLAAAGVNGTVRNIRINHANRGLNEGTAVVDLGDDAISMVLVVGLDGFTRPAIWRSLQRIAGPMMR